MRKSRFTTLATVLRMLADVVVVVGLLAWGWIGHRPSRETHPGRTDTVSIPFDVA